MPMQYCVQPDEYVARNVAGREALPQHKTPNPGAPPCIVKTTRGHPPGRAAKCRPSGRRKWPGSGNVNLGYPLVSSK